MKAVRAVLPFLTYTSRQSNENNYYSKVGGRGGEGDSFVKIHFSTLSLNIFFTWYILKAHCARRLLARRNWAVIRILSLLTKRIVLRLRACLRPFASFLQSVPVCASLHARYKHWHPPSIPAHTLVGRRLFKCARTLRSHFMVLSNARCLSIAVG